MLYIDIPWCSRVLYPPAAALHHPSSIIQHFHLLLSLSTTPHCNPSHPPLEQTASCTNSCSASFLVSNLLSSPVRSASPPPSPPRPPPASKPSNPPSRRLPFPFPFLVLPSFFFLPFP